MGRKLKFLFLKLHCQIYSSYYSERIACYCLRRVHNYELENVLLNKLGTF
jgi:hypothetical protein